MSEKSKHTPGPWVVDGEFYVRCKAYTIASVWMGIKTVEPTPRRAQANAQLIARAPEMAGEIADLRAQLAAAEKRATEAEHGIAALSVSVRALVEAMRKYEMDQEEQPPYQHRAMMTQAEFALGHVPARAQAVAECVEALKFFFTPGPGIAMPEKHTRCLSEPHVQTWNEKIERCEFALAKLAALDKETPNANPTV